MWRAPSISAFALFVIIDRSSILSIPIHAISNGHLLFIILSLCPVIYDNSLFAIHPSCLSLVPLFDLSLNAAFYNFVRNVRRRVFAPVVVSIQHNVRIHWTDISSYPCLINFNALTQVSNFTYICMRMCVFDVYEIFLQYFINILLWRLPVKRPQEFNS